MEDKHTEEQKYIRAKKKVKSIKGFYVHLTVYLLVNAFILLAQALSGGGWEVFGNGNHLTRLYFGALVWHFMALKFLVWICF